MFIHTFLYMGGVERVKFPTLPIGPPQKQYAEIYPGDD